MSESSPRSLPPAPWHFAVAGERAMAFLEWMRQRPKVAAASTAVGAVGERSLWGSLPQACCLYSPASLWQRLPPLLRQPSFSLREERGSAGENARARKFGVKLFASSPRLHRIASQ
eukprot:scaffold7095_cov260-Pinguiococcus_pyrenoidosus.AAC.25